MKEEIIFIFAMIISFLLFYFIETIIEQCLYRKDKKFIKEYNNKYQKVEQKIKELKTLIR